MHPFKLTPFLLLVLVSFGMVQPAFSDGLQRLELEKLEEVHSAVQALKAEWAEVPRRGPFREYRANLHVHSKWSHDSRGQIDEIVAAAKSVGTSVLMFSEHPADHYDFFVDGHQGVRDGVLLIPGAEMKGFLVYPTMSLKGLDPKTPQDLSDLVTGRNGQLFVCHPEERMEWEIQGVTGIEIYNTHADFKDETALISALRNPLRMIQLGGLLSKYPQECFSALRDYPADYLRKWDTLCLESPHTGVSANDAHQNVGLVVRWTEGDKAQVEDALEEKLIELSLAVIPDSAKLCEGKQPGDVLFRVLLDPYECSLRHVGTHLLLSELNADAVREALQSGRAFVAFDWMADSTGFDFAAVQRDRNQKDANQKDPRRLEMGTQEVLSGDYSLEGVAPLPVHWRLLCDGQVIHESDGRTVSLAVQKPGSYRAEAWLEIAGERTIWVLSNPVYFRAAKP